MNQKETMEVLDYNAWANDRLLEGAGALAPEQYLQDMKSSHGGIHGTLAHIVGAQKMWLSRWRGVPDTTVLSGKDLGSLQELIATWRKVNADTVSYLSSITEEKLNETFTMTTTAGKEFHHSYREALVHLINHSTYHRGQVASMMRQHGVKPPATDMIAYYRRNQ